MASSRTIWGIRALFINVSVLTLVQYGAQAADPMYYGFFFDDKTAASIKKAAESYLNATNSIPEVHEFLSNISSAAKVDNPLDYYAKPKDPNTEKDDPLYHITAKYCGKETEGQKQCTEYAKKHNESMGEKFQMELVGYVLTNRTFGVRIKLVGKKQCDLFDNGDGGAFACEEASTPGQSTKPDLPGLKWGTVEEWKFPVTVAKAHITVGCAPGVPAVTTGPDMLKAIGFENEDKQSWNETTLLRSTDPLLETEENPMWVGVYEWDAESDGDKVVVIYPRVKVVAEATFRSYDYSGGSSVLSVINGSGTSTLSALLLFSQVYLHRYF